MGTEPTYETATAASIIDITLTSKLAVSVQKWNVDRRGNFTDHNKITFELATDTVEMPPARRWDMINWQEFKTDLASRNIKLRETLNAKRLETILNKFFILI